MAIPTFVAAGAKAAGTGAVTPALPAGIAVNDICILVATTAAGGSVAITNNGGGAWTVVPSTPIDVPVAEKLYAWWRRHAGGDSAPTVTPGEDHICAGIAAFRGCIATGSPIGENAFGSEDVSDTTLSFVTGISTSVNDCLIILLSSTGALENIGQHSAQANANLTSIAERMDYCTNAGTGGGFECVAGGLATAGAIGTWTATLATISRKGYVTFALKPTVGIDVSLAALSTGDSTCLANLLRNPVLVATSDGISTTSASLAIDILLSALSQGGSTAQANLLRDALLMALSQGTSTATSDLTVGAVIEWLASLSQGSSTASASLLRDPGLVGTSNGLSTLVANLLRDPSLVGVSDGISSISASLAIDILLASLTQGLSSSQARLLRDSLLAGLSNGQSNALATLLRNPALVGLSDGTSTLIGDLTVTGLIDWLIGISEGGSTAEAILTVAHILKTFLKMDSSAPNKMRNEPKEMTHGRLGRFTSENR